jgi:hypothetical protein
MVGNWFENLLKKLKPKITIFPLLIQSLSRMKNVINENFKLLIMLI